MNFGPNTSWLPGGVASNLRSRPGKKAYIGCVVCFGVLSALGGSVSKEESKETFP